MQTQTQIFSAQESLKYLVELAALTDRNLAQQTVLKSDSLNVRAKLSQQRYQLLVLHDAPASQQEALNRLLRNSTSPPPAKKPPNNARKFGNPICRPRRPNSTSAGNTRNICRTSAFSCRTFRSRTLALLRKISFPRGIFTAVAALRLRRKKHKIEELKSTSRQAVLSAQDAEQQIQLDVNQKFRNLAEARALLDTQAAVQETEREKLRVMPEGFAVFKIRERDGRTFAEAQDIQIGDTSKS